MPLLEYKDEEALGRVFSVDTTTAIVRVTDIERLRKMQVNRLLALRSSKSGQLLIGIVQKITRSSVEKNFISSMDKLENAFSEEDNLNEMNLVRITLIGTLVDRIGSKVNIFRRTVETVPEIDACCFAVEGDSLTAFMKAISNVTDQKQKLSLGHYTLDEAAEAYLNGNKFFQRHAIIVGSTGSGKSWTTARILEQAALLEYGNAVLFDIHGEYKSLNSKDFQHFRIAGSGDVEKNLGLEQGVLYVPYWLLTYEAIISMFVDRSDQNAPNQAMVISRAIVAAKKKFLENNDHKEILDNFTIDSPVPFSMSEVMRQLEEANTEMVPGTRGEKQGDYFGKLSRLISRLENKISDRRLEFLFGNNPTALTYDWLEKASHELIDGKNTPPLQKGGVKIIDFSEVPSDILPLIVSLIARLIFSVQQWSSTSADRHPVAIFCDEAHLYIPERSQSNSTQQVSVDIFERIAKEGRKYGTGLVIISQRPAEVNRTVLSQCNNLIAMRLTNAEDQAVVRRLLPDSLGGFSDILPILDTGEALVVGDASLLPSRIRILEPDYKPDSGTINFWDEWSIIKPKNFITEAVHNWRRQNSGTAAL